MADPNQIQLRTQRESGAEMNLLCLIRCSEDSWVCKDIPLEGCKLLARGVVHQIACLILTLRPPVLVIEGVL